tara:strand:+ start:3082 stop:3546 length:465 start_codon:yes stop_codon:yes gene_type:complete
MFTDRALTPEEIQAMLSGVEGRSQVNAHENIDSIIHNNDNKDFYELANKGQQNPLDFIMKMFQGGTTNPNEMPKQFQSKYMDKAMDTVLPDFLKNMIPSMNTQPQGELPQGGLLQGGQGLEQEMQRLQLEQYQKDPRVESILDSHIGNLFKQNK